MWRVTAYGDPTFVTKEKDVMDEKVTGTYVVRGLLREVHRTARLRAMSEGTTLRSVVHRALRDYAAGTWTPSTEAPAPRRNGA
jgi:hypothetical protein